MVREADVRAWTLRLKLRNEKRERLRIIETVDRPLSVNTVDRGIVDCIRI